MVSVNGGCSDPPTVRISFEPFYRLRRTDRSMDSWYSRGMTRQVVHQMLQERALIGKKARPGGIPVFGDGVIAVLVHLHGRKCCGWRAAAAHGQAMSRS